MLWFLEVGRGGLPVIGDQPAQHRHFQPAHLSNFYRRQFVPAHQDVDFLAGAIEQPRRTAETDEHRVIGGVAVDTTDICGACRHDGSLAFDGLQEPIRCAGRLASGSRRCSSRGRVAGCDGCGLSAGRSASVGCRSLRRGGWRWLPLRRRQRLDSIVNRRTKTRHGFPWTVSEILGRALWGLGISRSGCCCQRRLVANTRLSDHRAP